MINQVLDIVKTELTDPFDGPYEGEDFWTEDEFMYIGNKNFILAAKVMREINNRPEFDKRLVKFKTAGDVVVLGFDSLADAEVIFTAKIGPRKEKTITLKESEDSRIALYINNERSSTSFKTLKASKSYIKKLHRTLCGDSEPVT